MTSDIIIFDRALKRLHRRRSRRLLSRHDLLLREAAELLVDHLDGITRNFPDVLDLGCRTGYVSDLLAERFGIENIIRSDSCHAFSGHVVADEEMPPFAADSFDLVISLLNLHWVNDLPGSLIQLNRCLKKDGLFIASIFGGATLHELRQSVLAAEISASGGGSPRISPFADVRDAAGLLQRAGFAMPVADTEKITIIYQNVYALMRDLRGIGETNALLKRRKNFTGKSFFPLVDEIYREKFGDKDGNLPATFEIITMSGTKN